MKELGIYMHIPFCKKKCSYCDFLSFSQGKEKQEQYIEELQKEIEQQAQKENDFDYEITTIYIGGGTPSLLEEAQIVKLLNTIYTFYQVSQNAEITIEVNPGTVDRKKIETYQKAGINRVSIGLQTTVEERLQELGRIHTLDQFIEVYHQSTEVGITNINVDLMIGIPNQTQEEVKESLAILLKLNPNHISVYSLILEEGTLLDKQVSQGKCCLPDEIEERKMYWQVKETLEQNGYEHYEISNFAKRGYESKHNSNCWDQKEYLGFGIGAHSYSQQVRYSNIENMETYLKNIQEDKIEQNKVIHEIQTQEEQKKEYMLLALRKIQGVDRKAFKQRFGEDPISLFRSEIELLAKEKLIKVSQNQIKLTNKGLDLANLVWEEFV